MIILIFIKLRYDKNNDYDKYNICNINILARIKYLPILLIVCYIYPSISRVKYSITGNHKLIEDQI